MGNAAHAAGDGSGALKPAQPLLLGLIGSPIMSSAAPAMHEAAAEALGLRAQYRLIDVPGADETKLRAMLDGVRLLGFSGVNVTFPYKEAVIPLLDALAPGAAAIGTANTVVVRDGRITGHNTDATGFASAFRAVLGNPGDAPVLLIGAGGVGRAIGFALAELGADALRIVDRETEKAQALAARLADRLDTQVCDTIAEALDGAGGVINGTPIGMLPNRDSPVPAELLHAGLWVADAVYTPLWTPLLQAARAAGARVMTGRELCIYQAADAFRLFTELEPSRERIGAAFDAVIAKRNEPR
ncbi:MAG: shikimate dehydrogenase [Alphaproteobacteria bacterium]|nr:MAG: shikimate dehydrogenase [Alphaproteobacteria bacterium]